MNLENSLEIKHQALIDLQEYFIKHLEHALLPWWQQALDQIQQTPDIHKVMQLSSQCKRYFNDDPILSLYNNLVWSPLRLARLLLLTQALIQQPVDTQQTFLHQAFAWVDDQEKISILKVINWLDNSGCCLDLVQQAGRTSNSQLFAAIALNNAYPMHHYTERAFHQLILKALSMSLEIQHMVGLVEHRGPVLNQLALELLEEQLAADRAISDDLIHLVAFSLLTSAQRKYLEDLCLQRRLAPIWQDHLVKVRGSERLIVS